MNALRFLFAAIFVGAAAFPATGSPFVIRVVDTETGRGVPLVELRTVHHAVYHTDNAGVVTVDDPELLNREVFFHVGSHGYSHPEDGFGYRGSRLLVKPGGESTIEVERVNIAERLYRITGAGLYDHSVRAGLAVPLYEPLMNALVLGSDSAHVTPWKGKLFWIWGDTNRPGYPLGNFQVPGAVSYLPESGGLDPEIGIDLSYFKDEKGFAKKLAPLPGKGPTWLTGLVSLPDREGEERLVAHFVKVRKGLEIYRRGLCEWDEEKEEFSEVLRFSEEQESTPTGHPFRVTEGGRTFLVFADPVPFLRIADSYEAWKDPGQYEALDTPEDFHDTGTGARVRPHRGSITWNEHRNRWVMIFTESGGKSSYLGEVWYAEAKAYSGPWNRCVRVVTHDDYSFYNPVQHPEFARDGGRRIYFEGTYTTTFSKNPVKTPKYNYNQVLYALDLDDERLLPARVK
jgi:hypothetical protein